jgi:hypothetical protein
MGTLQLVKCLLVQMYACRLLIALYIYREEVGERDLDIPHTRPRCLVRLPEPFLFRSAQWNSTCCFRSAAILFLVCRYADAGASF